MYYTAAQRLPQVMIVFVSLFKVAACFNIFCSKFKGCLKFLIIGLKLQVATSLNILLERNKNCCAIKIVAVIALKFGAEIKCCCK